MQESKCEKYIESLAGIISPSEFELQVKHLIKIPDYSFNIFVNNIELKVSKTNAESTLNTFLEYVKSRRTRNCSSAFYSDVAKLRYCNQIKENEEIKVTYDKLFRLNRKLLWEVIPFDFNAVKETPIDIFYKKVKYITGDATLETALRRTCVLHLEDNLDKLLSELKKLLLIYHPDKNKHVKAELIFSQVKKIYQAVNLIFKKYEYFYEDTIFCDIREFLRWKLKNIEECEVHNYIVSLERPLREKCKVELRYYKEKVETVSEVNNEIIKVYVSITERLCVQIECMLAYPHAVLESAALSNNSDFFLCEVCIRERDGIKRTIEYLENYINIDLQQLQRLFTKLQFELQQLLKQFTEVKYEFDIEIRLEIHNLNDAKNIYDKYSKQKRINNLKSKLIILQEKEYSAQCLLTDISKILNSLNEELVIKVAVPHKKSLIERARNCCYSVVSKLKSYTSHKLEDSLFEDYHQLYNMCRNLKVKLRKCHYEIDNNYEYSFVKVKLVVKNLSFDDNGQFLYVYECNDDTPIIKAEFKKLSLVRESLEEKLKRKREQEKENEECTLLIKDLKKELELNKKEIEQLKHECETVALKIRNKKTEEILKAEEEIKRFKQDAKRAEKEKKKFLLEAEMKMKMADAKVKVYEIFLCEMKNQGLNVRELEKDIKDFLWQLFAFCSFCNNIATEFEYLSSKCRKLREEIIMDQCKQEYADQLQTDYDKLCNIFASFQHEKNEYITNSTCSYTYDKIIVSIKVQIAEAENLAIEKKQNAENEKKALEKLSKCLTSHT